MCVLNDQLQCPENAQKVALRRDGEKVSGVEMAEPGVRASSPHRNYRAAKWEIQELGVSFS